MTPLLRSRSYHALYHYVALLFVLLDLSIVSPASQLTEVITVTAAPTIPTSPSYLYPSQFKDAVLSRSNAYRRRHGAQPLEWNSVLASYARNWGSKCLWKHSGGPYGENLAYGFPNASAAISAWGDEGHQYNFHLPTGFTEHTGHFTQLVWRSTTDIGCAAIDCGYHPNGASSERRAKGWYVVCEYAPPGNVVGRDKALFENNVLPASAAFPANVGFAAESVPIPDPLRSHTSHATAGSDTATSAGQTATATAASGASKLLIGGGCLVSGLIVCSLL